MAIRIDGTNTTANPGITGADADTGLQFGTNELKLVTGGTEAVKIDSNQKLTASQGILFGTDTAAVNTLDDYEEGTWTPEFAGGTTAGTYTYDFQVGNYVKIGNHVTVQCYLININTSSAGTGILTVTGLPFTAKSGSGTHSGAIRLSRFNVVDDTVSLCVSINGGSSSFTVTESRDAQSAASVSVTDRLDSASDVLFTASFPVD